MQRNMWRALLLAVTVVLVGALPAMAQSDSDKGWLLTTEDDNAIIAANRDVAVGASETVEGVVIIKGNALIEGTVTRLFAADADVVIRGPSGSVEDLFTAGGTLTLEDGATLGDGYYLDTDVSGVDEMLVTGEFADASKEFAPALAAIVTVLVILFLIVLIGVIIAMLFATLLVIAFGTKQTRQAAATISNDVLKTIVVGLLMLIVPSVVFGILFVTVIGIPLALVLLVLWGGVAFLGQIVVAVWIGERILPRARTANRPYGAAFLGMIILILLSVTAIVPLLVGIFGTGAVTLAGWRVLRSGGMPPVPPGYGEPYGQPWQAPPPPYAPPPYAPPPPQYAPPPPQPGQQGQWPPQDGQPPSSWPQG